MTVRAEHPPMPRPQCSLSRLLPCPRQAMTWPRADSKRGTRPRDHGPRSCHKYFRGVPLPGRGYCPSAGPVLAWPACRGYRAGPYQVGLPTGVRARGAETSFPVGLMRAAGTRNLPVPTWCSGRQPIMAARSACVALPLPGGSLPAADRFLISFGDCAGTGLADVRAPSRPPLPAPRLHLQRRPLLLTFTANFAVHPDKRGNRRHRPRATSPRTPVLAAMRDLGLPADCSRPATSSSTQRSLRPHPPTAALRGRGAPEGPSPRRIPCGCGNSKRPLEHPVSANFTGTGGQSGR